MIGQIAVGLSMTSNPASPIPLRARHCHEACRNARVLLKQEIAFSAEQATVVGNAFERASGDRWTIISIPFEPAM